MPHAAPDRASTVQPQSNPVGIALVEGRIVPASEARIPLLDWGFLRSDAVQDTVSVFHGRFFRLDDHLARFERNWQRLRMQNPYDADTVRAILMEAVRRTGLREAYVQMLMTRGRAPRSTTRPTCWPTCWSACSRRVRGCTRTVRSPTNRPRPWWPS